MPRERIHSDNHPDVVLDIAWGPSGTVQIATLNEQQAEEHGGGSPLAGWYTDLGRAGINKAIRTLRRARDAAYGKDE